MVKSGHAVEDPGEWLRSYRRPGRFSRLGIISFSLKYGESPHWAKRKFSFHHFSRARLQIQNKSLSRAVQRSITTSSYS